VTLKLRPVDPNEDQKTFARALQAELTHALASDPQAFPLQNLATPGWHPSTPAHARIENLACHFTPDGLVHGTFHIHFQEFLQRDCQDLLTEAMHTGIINFELNRTTSQIQFTAPPHPTRDYDPEEF
jgi:hypothetical protein